MPIAAIAIDGISLNHITHVRTYRMSRSGLSAAATATTFHYRHTGTLLHSAQHRMQHLYRAHPIRPSDSPPLSPPAPGSRGCVTVPLAGLRFHILGRRRRRRRRRSHRTIPNNNNDYCEKLQLRGLPPPGWAPARLAVCARAHKCNRNATATQQQPAAAASGRSIQQRFQ